MLTVCRKEHWIAEPELVIPPVRGCEILSDILDTTPMADLSSPKEHSNDGLCLYRRVHRRLLPKRIDKDKPLEERVELWITPPASTTTGRCSTAIVPTAC
jgi:hypothetical protein